LGPTSTKKAWLYPLKIGWPFPPPPKIQSFKMKKVRLNDDVFSPSKIVCIGGNYQKHRDEMGYKKPDKDPTIFLKPNSSISFKEKEVFIPESYGLLHYEVELCFLVGRECKNVSQEEAAECMAGYCVGLDMTLRDMQAADKDEGKPWNIAKGFDNAAILGEFVAAEKVDNILDLDVSLKLNGELKQKGNTSQMLYAPFDMLEFVSRYMTLEPGDIFMTGTPSGIGPVEQGDVILAEVEGLPAINVRIRRK